MASKVEFEYRDALFPNGMELFFLKKKTGRSQS